jgi:glycosyltransferase involved in cell wall biosynthesis
MRVEICLPVKDEEKILADNLQRILDFCLKANLNFEWKIIGLVNGSSDKTAQIFSEFKQKNPSYVDYVELSQPGKGRAIREYWLNSTADILAYLDIDLAVLPNQLPELLLPIINEEADLVIGSRLMPESKTNRSLFREATSRSFNSLVSILLPNKVSDLQCGFKAVKREVFNRIVKEAKDNYWLFDTELIVLSYYYGFRVKEIPVSWDENRYQKRVSKVKIIRDMGKFLKGLFLLRIRLYFIRRAK